MAEAMDVDTAPADVKGKRNEIKVWYTSCMETNIGALDRQKEAI